MASTFWRPRNADRDRPVAVPSLVAIGACSYLYIAFPDGVGRLAFVAAASICLMVLVIGPRLRGIESASFVLLPVSAASAFLLSLAARPTPQEAGIAYARLADAASLTGYILLALWLRQLSGRYTPRNKYETWLDSLMVATGASIMFWSLAIAPSLARDSLSAGTLLLALYPAADVVLVTMTAQLMYRIGSPIPAMAWFLMAVSTLLIVDTLYTVLWMSRPGLSLPLLTAWYLFAYAGFALGMYHPSVVTLAQGGVCTGQHPRIHRRRGLALLFILLPSVACVAYPTHGLFDTVVRTLLIGVAVVLVYARLEYALRQAEHAEESSRRQAQRDPLTGLGNRLRLAQQLPQALRNAAADGRTLGVLLLDLDGFKRINDTWGHSVGDETLKAVAQRLQDNTPWALFTARLGGDEFLVCTQEDAEDAVIERAEELRSLITEPVPLLRGLTMSITPSIGITCVAPTPDHTAEQMLHEADVALYEAKRQGKARNVVYEGSVRKSDRFKRGLMHDLKSAIAGRELGTAFQPIVSTMEPHRVHGWEALARWQHPTYGFVSPRVFIAVAEEHGMLDDVFRLIIGDVIDLLRARNGDAGGHTVHEWASVNVTPAQVMGSHFDSGLLEQLRDASMPPSWLRLEVTETALMPGDELAKGRFDDLREAGVGMFLDDFGTGFAGIGILRKLPFDAVKVDRSFVGTRWSEPDVAALRGIIELARGLDIRSVIAEGVETAEDALHVRDLGIELAQGWFYGAPAIASNPGLSRAGGGRGDARAT